MSKLKLTRRRLLAFAATACISLSCAFVAQRLATAEDKSDTATAPGRLKDERAETIESALFARTEFFGARALVPYPTAEARNRLADVLEKYPNEPQIILKLSQLDEKLGRYEEAEREIERFVGLQPDSPEALETLAAFFGRRAQFEKEAATIERLLAVAPAERRAQIFRRLLELARLHRLENYLKPDFYQQYIEQDAGVSGIIEELLDKLTGEANYAEALKVLRRYKERVPERRSSDLLEREVSLLVSLKKDAEAERVYQEAFDPFWPEETSSEFYSFLSDRERFRAYGHELAAAFARNPADFDAAVRLIHYRNYTGEKSSRITAELEQARAKRRIIWKPEELATLARILIADGDGDTASRFLYTLYVRNELKPGSPLRARVLYQLFELLSDARHERLALTRGDLKFYQDIATSDPHPGMIGGVLSLILSDTDPASELEAQDERAVQYFNRAAAFRIFTAYKQEYPTSAELAQMYLDIVRLYAAAKEPKIAEETLAEFEGRYGDAPEYAAVALKLADCYVALGRAEEERAAYQRIMDYLGERRVKGRSLVPAAGDRSQTGAAGGEQRAALNIYSEPTETKPAPGAYPPQSNQGISISAEDSESTSADYDDYSESRYTDFLSTVSLKPQGDSARARGGDDVTYAEVLERHVASLAREKRTEAILSLYANELKKYPEEQGLYEQMLQWLGQTNLFEEQLKVHKQALQKFPTTLWRDRLARWFIRRERRQEFEIFSRELIEHLSDREVQEYLARFVGGGAAPNASAFEAQLYRGLYTLAHERFPHNLSFVQGLLKFYSAHGRWEDWRGLMAEYYFASPAIRDEFLSHLASRKELRVHLERARARCLAQTNADERVLDTLPYKLFRADAAVRLSNYEEAIDAYRELNRLYPNTPEFSERLIAFTRSLGQHNPKLLEEAASAARELAAASPASAAYRTRAGEIQAELGDYERARGEWEQLIRTGRGAADTYLETATVYWDYFQYGDALRTIEQLREQMNNSTLYAFQAGAILEAQHKTAEALGEYVKALDFYGSGDAGALDGDRAKRRLAKLYRREGIPAKLQLAFERERARRRLNDSSSLVLDYADLLNDAGAKRQAATLLRQEIARSDSREFLESALNILDEDEGEGEGVGQLALRRLVAVAGSPRFAISYRLRLAADAEQHGRREEAQAVVRELVGKFPTNYGVLNEAESFYWRVGLREDSVRVLSDAMGRGKGRFYYIFGRKLAARLTLMNRLPAARDVLARLHAEDKLNTEVFRELARVLIRTSQTDALKKAFAETLAAIKAQDLDLKEMHAETAALRKQMIDAFTRLKDYRAAIEQHIEIINREPEDEENVAAAIDYARRHGGADTLLAYYRRTSEEAYKNYRWNVVLARIYDAGNDLPSAAQNYREAIANQPEMVELYDALADVYTRMKNTDAALASLNRAAELTNDDPQYIRRIVEVLEKAGRQREAAEARRKLPDIAPKKETVGDHFADAARLRAVERSKAVAAYRLAFDAFFADPSAHGLKAGEITGYVQTVRDEERLDHITARLWQLRDKLIQESERENSTRAGQARSSLHVLDGALPEAVGTLAAQKGTGDELSALFADFNRRIEDALRGNDAFETLALLQNLSHRSGFGVLEEKILSAQKDAAFRTGNPSFYQERLQRLIDFYNARGDYRRVIDLMEAERAERRAGDSFEPLRVIAENARLLGDREKELQALRDNYRRLAGSSSNQLNRADAQAGRYFEALYENGEQGKQELRALAQQASPYQLQLINFLLARGDGELAHEAIERAPFSEVWKLSRHAGASLALRDYSTQSEGYFAAALQLKSIGELVNVKPDASRQLVGDDWFQLAQSYGQWLGESRHKGATERAPSLLAALVENRPRDPDEQTKLGRFFLDKKDYKRALEHLSLALEMNPSDNNARAALGSALFLSNDKVRAVEAWSEIVKGDHPGLAECVLYLGTLRAHGLAAEAREKLSPIVVEQVAQFSDYEIDDDNANSFGTGERQKQLQSLRELIRALARSVRAGSDEASGDEPRDTQADGARAKFFYKLSEAVSNNNLLPKMLIKESLISDAHLRPFYELLIKRSPALSSYERDYDYTAQLANTWSTAEAEEALDQELAYKISEPPSERIRWQKEYLDYLIAHDERAAARRIVSAIETDISRRYARPAWLRLMSLRLDLLDGQAEKALAGLRRFVGIEVAADRALINPPSVERLNMAVSMLRAEGRAAEADELLEAAYTRELALERYEAHAFTGLARLAFHRGDGAFGLKMLQTMVALSDEQTRATAAAELASWPRVKVYAADRARQDGAETENTLDRAETLQLAADTAAAFAQFDAAIDYRRQLFAVSPEDETNRIELARLLAEMKKHEEAVAELAQIIGDRTATRRARWQAVCLAPEIIGVRYDLRPMLIERVRALNAGDNEMLAALSSSVGERTDESVKLFDTLEATNPNPYLNFYGALLEKRLHSDGELKGFIRTLVAGSDETVVEAFGFAEESPLRQIIRFYAVKGQPRAALLASELDPVLKESKGTERDAAAADTSEAGEKTQVDAQESALQESAAAEDGARYRTLRERAAERELVSRRELLGLLSTAAEQIRDINRAVEFESSRLKLLRRTAERQTAQARIRQLLLRRQENSRRGAVAYSVDQSLVARR
ncbi:MAG TPA: tetratricopeptide repeat protein [Pyrinomonadaceae bacterium]|nr:tetratricopeptide repeat protein [Pyrinomonadaceae bacterium]